MSSVGSLKKFTAVLCACGALVVFAYVLGGVYLWSQQDRFIFRPGRDITRTPADVGLAFENVFIPVAGNSGGERVHAWWIPSATPDAPVLIYLHGNALNISANVEHAQRLHGLGVSVLMLSYRGYGRSDGDRPSEAKTCQDADAGWRYLSSERNIPPADILIYGHSLGGAVAIELAVRHPEARGLIVESTFTSIRDMAARSGALRIFPLDLILARRFDSLSKVGRLRLPVLFLHGTDDTVVPPEMSRRLYEQTRAPKRLQLISGGGHNDSAQIGGPSYLQAITDFLNATASGARTPR